MNLNINKNYDKMDEVNNNVSEPKEETKVREKITKGKVVILYNDDYNSFEFVIECLIKYCKKNNDDAIVCTFQVHNEGKSIVFKGDDTEMRCVTNDLKSKGLNAKLEEI